MKMRRNVPLNILTQAWPPRKVPAWPATSVKKDPPKRHALQPPEYTFNRIDDLLGDFSEQTGANFG